MGLFMKKALVIIITCAVCLFAVSYLLRVLEPQEKCPVCMPLPELPSPYQKYEFHRLDDMHRNYYVQKFYQAWKKKETYAICDQGAGIDTCIAIFWITEHGKITRIIADHLNFTGRGQKLYTIHEVDSVSVYSWLHDDEVKDGKSLMLVEIDPDKIVHRDLLIKATSQKSDPNSSGK